MAIIGKLLKNRRAGDHNLAWELENLRGGASFELTSPDFEHETTLDPRHVSKRIGGQDLSPALAWSAPPKGTAQLLLVVEDPDAPMGLPFVHALALMDPALTALPRGGLTAANPAPGVELLRSGWGSGYTGPAPIKSHGPHRYAFQLFALSEPLTTVKGKSPAAAKPRDVMSAAVSHARARTDGFYERP
jgi:phosphatidylethanolamine-binding protein (PEBP) family uncharacterized protein